MSADSCLNQEIYEDEITGESDTGRSEIQKKFKICYKWSLVLDAILLKIFEIQEENRKFHKEQFEKIKEIEENNSKVLQCVLFQEITKLRKELEEYGDDAEISPFEAINIDNVKNESFNEESNDDEVQGRFEDVIEAEYPEDAEVEYLDYEIIGWIRIRHKFVSLKFI